MTTEKCFDSRRDRQILESGGFYCLGCLVSAPAIEASPDPRYCRRCYGFMRKNGNSETKDQFDFWEEGGMVYCTGGHHWGIDKVNGDTICLGKAKKDKDGKPLNLELPPLPAPTEAYQLPMAVGDKYRIEDDGLNIVVYQKRQTKKGDTQWDAVFFFATIKGALEHLEKNGKPRPGALQRRTSLLNRQGDREFTPAGGIGACTIMIILLFAPLLLLRAVELIGGREWIRL